MKANSLKSFLIPQFSYFPQIFFKSLLLSVTFNSIKESLECRNSEEREEELEIGLTDWMENRKVSECDDVASNRKKNKIINQGMK